MQNIEFKIHKIKSRQFCLDYTCRMMFKQMNEENVEYHGLTCSKSELRRVRQGQRRRKFQFLFFPSCIYKGLLEFLAGRTFDRELQIFGQYSFPLTRDQQSFMSMRIIIIIIIIINIIISNLALVSLRSIFHWHPIQRIPSSIVAPGKSIQIFGRLGEAPKGGVTGALEPIILKAWSPGAQSSFLEF